MGTTPHSAIGLGIAALLAIAVLPGGNARADELDPGFPAIDVAREPALLPAASPLEAWSIGDWTQGPERVTAKARQPHEKSLLLVPQSDDGMISSGLARAIVEVAPGTDADFTLVLRYQPGANIDDFAAYGASVEGGRLLLYQWSHGRAFPMGPAVALKKLGRHRALELVAFLAGPYLGVFLYDAKTLELLGTVTHRDTTIARGHIGIRFPAAAATRESLTRLSILRDAGGERGEASPIGSSGEGRLVTIDPDDVERVPVPLRSGLLEPIAGDPPGRLLHVTRPSDVERLKRAGVRVRAESANVAWIHVDRRFRAAVGRGAAGPELDSYKDNAMVGRALSRVAGQFPSITRRKTLGVTHEGRPIWALRVTTDPDGAVDKPTILINGAHHGSELCSIEYALDALDTLLSMPAREREGVLSAFDFWFVPLVNPDGNEAFLRRSQYSGRKNGRDLNGDGRFDPEHEGVDLNRNYPFEWGGLGEQGSRSWPLSHIYRGPAPASEPETQAMIALAREHHFVASISFHTAATAVLPPYTVESVRRPEPDTGWTFAEAIVRDGPKQPNGQRFRVRPRLYPVDGVDQDWHAWAHGTMALLVEGSLHNPKDWNQARASVASTRFIFQRFLSLVRKSPRLSLHVRDRLGNPVSANVRVEELATFAGETWTSRARDGRFDLLVPGEGRYHLRLEAANRPLVRVEVEANRPQVIVLDSGS